MFETSKKTFVITSCFTCLLNIADANQENLFEDDFLEDEKNYLIGGFARTGFDLIFLNAKDEFDPLLTSFSKIRLEGLYEYQSLVFDVALDGTFSLASTKNSLLYQNLWNLLPRNRLLGLSENYFNDFYTPGYILHRFSLAYNSEHFSIKIGRQVITWGEGRALNPFNLITPIDALIIDFEDISSADAINFTGFFNRTDFLQIVFLPYLRHDKQEFQNIHIEDSNFLLRGKMTWKNTDITLTTGYHFRSVVSGVETVFSSFGFLWRVAYFFRWENQNNLEFLGEKISIEIRTLSQALLGFDKNLSQKLRLSSEIFLSSSYLDVFDTQRTLAGYDRFVNLKKSPSLDKDESFFLTSGRILTRNPLFLQVSLNYEVNEVLFTNFFLLYDIVGSSALFVLSLEYSITDSLSLTSAFQAGAYNNNDSEFQGLSPRCFFYVRWYL